MKISKWYNEHSCSSCNHPLTRNERINQGGRCIYCGVKGPNACTIVTTIEKAVRYKYLKPWYIFWQKPIKEYK